ncbi:segregation and condensation protein A [Endothiovibrio diazotrophicus]
MDFDHLSKDQRILQMMRKTLTNVIRDVTPPPGHVSPITEGTSKDIRDCLALISARERELAEELGQGSDLRPRFTDEPKQAEVIPLHKSGLTKKS